MAMENYQVCSKNASGRHALCQWEFEVCFYTLQQLLGRFSGHRVAHMCTGNTKGQTRTAAMKEAEVEVLDGTLRYDVTGFLRHHPGGANTLAALRGRDVSAAMRRHHSAAARYLAREYAAPPDPVHDLEVLVDWSRPMLAQVGALGSRYHEWMSSPVDRPLRLFHSPLLEALSVTPWYVVPIFWLPVITIVFARGLADNALLISSDYLQVLWSVPVLLAGGLLWSLLEYSIHRWVFHMRPPDDSPMLITLHFLLHGLHHKVPFDSGRLLFPPVLAAVIAYFLYSVLQLLSPAWMIHYLMAGAITGYVTYDMMHFYLHYGSPAANTYLYNMKRYHNQHHFAHHESGFGISSSFWDRVFRTEIILKKLNVILRW